MSALFANTTAFYNTAVGTFALIANSTGASNTVTGSFALQNNTTGSDNTVTGAFALRSNTIGNNNTASGQAALSHNTTGSNNTAVGQNGLRSNKTGSSNIGLGVNAGSDLTTGDNNIDIANRGVAGEANTIRIGKQGTQTATFIAGISGATEEHRKSFSTISKAAQCSKQRHLAMSRHASDPSRLFVSQPVDFARQQGAFSACSVRPALVVQNS